MEGTYSWTFTLTNGTEIVVPKYTNLALYYSDGNNKQPIEDATLSVGLSETFSIICEPAEGCNWSYKVLENDDNWEITRTNQGLNIVSTEEGGAATIQFTLTTKNNQVFFYQVKVTAEKEKVEIIEKEDNAELVAALKDALKNIPGVNINEDGDIEITQEVIDNQTALDLYSQSLTSLDGLEIFSNLERLNCSDNNLTDIDVTVFPKLTYLDCSNNKLDDLDVSELESLTELYCSENELTTLDVSGLKGLTHLSCSDNKLTTLDVSGLETLTKLWCSNNNLTTLNVSGVETITELWCANNELITLDLSTLKSLEILHCENCLSQPEVTSRSLVDGVLDMSGNPELEELYCANNGLLKIDVTQCPDLRVLECGENKLTSLDVTKNESLEQLGCDINELTALDLTHTPNIRFLHCNDNKISVLDVTALTQLRFLHCMSNNFTELILSNNLNLYELYCGYNNITDLDVSKNTSLRELSCENSLVKTLDISNNTNLEVLYCKKCQLTSLDITNNDKLHTIICGVQKNKNGEYYQWTDQNLILTLTEAQKTLWLNNWKNESNNANVTILIPGENLINGGSQVPNIGNGGVF